MMNMCYRGKLMTDKEIIKRERMKNILSWMWVCVSIIVVIGMIAYVLVYLPSTKVSP